MENLQKQILKKKTKGKKKGCAKKKKSQMHEWIECLCFDECLCYKFFCVCLFWVNVSEKKRESANWDWDKVNIEEKLSILKSHSVRILSANPFQWL